MEEAGIQSFSTCTFYYRNTREGFKKAKEALQRKPLQAFTQLLPEPLLAEACWPRLWADRCCPSKDSTHCPPNRQSRTRRFPQRPGRPAGRRRTREGGAEMEKGG